MFEFIAFAIPTAGIVYLFVLEIYDYFKIKKLRKEHPEADVVEQ